MENGRQTDPAGRKEKVYGVRSLDSSKISTFRIEKYNGN